VYVTLVPVATMRSSSLLSLSRWEILEGIRGKRSWDSLETADEEGGDGIGISTDHILQSRHLVLLRV
jgi:hypothetical protein